ncbi:hypothetical protein AX17_005837 [Amanita inopinata Kibby_2008]|nr:hypothetical protein AX17_005837 [Amanita inopinata Kibby_2008]
MPRAFLTIAVVLLAIVAGVYQLYLKPILSIAGYQRHPESIGNKDCRSVPELKACEKLVIHQPSGVIYLACSNPISRTFWIPAVGRLNETAASRDDYVAIYDPKSSQVTRLKVKNFGNVRGLSLHGMDVVPSSTKPEQLFVYLINHRAPPNGQSANLVGADSVVEIFETQVGSSVLTHVKTVEDPAIITPNDVIGYGDGQTFYVTNDHGEKTGLLRELDSLGRASTSVAFCAPEGCKIAIKGMHSMNGITKASNDTIYVANSAGGGMYILERQRDNSLVLVEYIKTDRCLDNLSVDTNGAVWAAGFLNIFTVLKHFGDPSILAPSSALRFTLNTGPAAFYGEKYKIDTIFEDDGTLASGVTSVAYDSERKRLFLHGLASPRLVVCRL